MNAAGYFIRLVVSTVGMAVSLGGMGAEIRGLADYGPPTRGRARAAAKTNVFQMKKNRREVYANAGC